MRVYRWMLCLCFFSALCAPALAAQEALPRRIALGVQVKPVSVETQQRLKLRNTRGVEVVAVVPDTTAASAGIAAGDVILALGDQAISDVAGFVEQVGQARAGSELPIQVQRADGTKTLKANPKPLPQETSSEFEIQYGSVPTAQGRLRTVTTIPKDAKKAKAVLLLCGLGLGFAEHPTADPLGMKAMAYALTRQGFVVMRVDRPGCGDSEGGPARDADFQAVVNGYIAAATALKQHAQVDADQITLMGFSAGGLEAPLVAAQVPVQRIAVFGCLNMNWQEYLQSTMRRQLRVGGAPASEIEKLVSLQSAGWHYLIFEELTPDDLAAQHAELSEWVDETWLDGKYFSGIHYKFFQQLGRSNIAEAWERFQGPVLTMWGDRDVVTSKEEHELIAEIANKREPGSGKFMTIPGVDHNLQTVQQTGKPGVLPPQAVVDALVQWINGV